MNFEILRRLEFSDFLWLAIFEIFQNGPIMQDKNEYTPIFP